MNFTADTWLALIALLLSVGWPAFMYFTKSTAKDEAQDLIDAQSKILNDHEIRLVRLEERMNALPGQRDHAKLMSDVKDMQGDIKVLVSALGEVRRGQDRTETQINIINESLGGRSS